jgi:hypothetical protein
MVSSNDGMAEVLNKFFASMFCKEGAELVPEVEVMDCTSKLDGSRITEEKVKEKIKNLRSKSAAGPDQIGPSLLQQLLEICSAKNFLQPLIRGRRADGLENSKCDSNL